ncbi:hypothetical protein R1flu_005012 [Riccia fluitans]|uniref:Uncharacterized protein n=1 Tax=Riccia fluitans TaxID=41844 RepID=A0ABD1YSI7_9MARC
MFVLPLLLLVNCRDLAVKSISLAGSDNRDYSKWRWIPLLDQRWIPLLDLKSLVYHSMSVDSKERVGSYRFREWTDDFVYLSKLSTRTRNDCN